MNEVNIHGSYIFGSKQNCKQKTEGGRLDPTEARQKGPTRDQRGRTNSR